MKGSARKTKTTLMIPKSQTLYRVSSFGKRVLKGLMDRKGEGERDNTEKRKYFKGLVIPRKVASILDAETLHWFKA